MPHPQAEHLAELHYISKGMLIRPYGVPWPIWEQLPHDVRRIEVDTMDLMLELGHVKPGH